MARVAVLMSGGVDSSAAALILARSGHEVLGLTAKMWSESSRCCGAEDIYRAQRVCHKLGIPHVVLDLTAEFKQKVVDDFARSYLEGLTPNPCAVCNREIKFGSLVEAAARFGFDRVATGHYAALRPAGSGMVLVEPADRRKSQVYFLSLVRKQVLARLEFPLAQLGKQEARGLVEAAGLPAREGESQDLCFVPSGKYDELLRTYGGDPGRGSVVDKAGRVVATHRGHFAYTVGQRFGVGGRRCYVVRKSADRNELVVGTRADVTASSICARSVNWFIDVEGGTRSVVMIRHRYNSAPQKGRVLEAGPDRLKVTLDEPCVAPAPGQVLACYGDDGLVCGGIIEGPGLGGGRHEA
jgi:tRNA-uridine 2-sulfurtransferase